MVINNKIVKKNQGYEAGRKSNKSNNKWNNYIKTNGQSFFEEKIKKKVGEN